MNILTHGVGSPTLWVAFLAGVLLMLALDLGVFNRKAHAVKPSEALAWSIVWIALSLSFNGYIYATQGATPAIEFLSAYLIEKALSVDNLFVFIVIFRYMGVAPQVMHRVLFAGIVGALLLRGVFILVGIELIEAFAWTLYLFGAFLAYTGFRLLFTSDETVDPSESLVYRFARKMLPLTKGYVGSRFFSSEGGKLRATPLFVVLCMVETSDVVFALDSIPAVFGVSRDPFIVFSSNVCAILGLRAMFFLLEHVLGKVAYLKYGLGLVLSFIGAKMILAEGIGVIPPFHVSVSWSLLVVAGLIGASIAASLAFPPKPGDALPLDLVPQASMVATAEVLRDATKSASEASALRPAAGPDSDEAPPTRPSA